jgi:hypothetical protein
VTRPTACRPARRGSADRWAAAQPYREAVVHGLARSDTLFSERHDESAELNVGAVKAGFMEVATWPRAAPVLITNPTYARCQDAPGSALARPGGQPAASTDPPASITACAARLAPPETDVLQLTTRNNHRNHPPGSPDPGPATDPIPLSAGRVNEGQGLLFQ